MTWLSISVVVFDVAWRSSCCATRSCVDERGIAAVLEASPALAGRQQAAKLLVAQDWRWLVGNVGRLHLGHRADADLALLNQPSEEALEAAVAVRDGRQRANWSVMTLRRAPG